MPNGTQPGDGITGGYTGNSLALKITIATLAGITWYNAIELIILVFVTFSRYRGCYFWSLLISSSIGLVPYSVGFLLKFFQLTEPWLSVTFITIGWWCMVTGQSIVLYSRLHLVLRNPRILRRVLTLILVDAVIFHIPTTVLTYGSNIAGPDTRSVYIRGYKVMEKIQMTGFCLQEFLISGLYIWETIRMLRLDPDRGKRKIMYQLVAINLIIILMDLGLLVVEYMNKYIMETMIKGVIYSIKLKLEFAVLGKLVYLVHNHVWKADPAAVGIDNYQTESYREYHYPDFVDATRVTFDLTHAVPPASFSAPRRRSHPYMDSDDISIAMFEHSENANANANAPPSLSPLDPAISRSEISQSWSGETQRDVSPLDFTELHLHNPIGRAADKPG
ncbi:hypothetical protein CDV55_106376 [Aspergillus turcosus]|nr:hypothetical protein CDV55_106376 [Aspergillus turcosus]